MHFDNSFAVTAPIDEVWETLMAFERVAGCVPGATLVTLSEDTFEVTMRVKVGPIVMQYKGTLEVVERDAAARRAVVRGRAQEVKGQGAAEGTVELRLVDDGDFTRGTSSAEVKLSGRAAAMGKGVISKVGDQLMAQFAQNLQALLNEPTAEAGDHVGDPGVPERSGSTVVGGVETLAAGTGSAGVLRAPDDATPGTAPVEQVEGDPVMTGGRRGTDAGDGLRTEVPATRMPEAPVSGGAQSNPAARVSDRVSAAGRPERAAGPRTAAAAEPESLDALALVGSMVKAQLGQPRVLLGLLPAGVLVGFWLGRRSKRR